MNVPILEPKGGGSTQKVGHWIGLKSSRLTMVWSWQMESSEVVSGHVRREKTSEQAQIADCRGQMAGGTPHRRGRKLVQREGFPG